MSLWSRLIAWIDRGWARDYPRSIYAGCVAMPLGGLVALASETLVLKIVGLGLSAFWTLLFLWRWIVVVRHEAVVADRRYDRLGKFGLAAEYHATESATAAKRRKRKNG